ncbi:MULTISPECIES: peptide-methionine (S)-S-oxide reductase [Pseudoalteromonas]|uniref:peptide-methionine (S)-S-oxide reductase n=1 Tax=Pseudoalteromonas haloplanktis TaxID=228 RepID=A0ABU1BEX8_PSEHA|nr:MULTISPECIES: peptide-methionine (S)-S-oxide reductase [Pseudoalteromonas]MCF6145296.1 peptide-methionine (S)-S-oxide reductase [Pseudoalteromonas mariniglutinosa NCIMB 1770]MDQ9092812.1 peptide-methionine (S)-S-oxide reductase [Pseudoalteromonas haloplanktis]TMN70314.1 peptide methionine sulfoxide reductase [Pseudoalteromonas sp. S1727]BDF94827.1 peptide methionine sulfoxide reductase MsrA [Pseudoalteromonas sp. KAN5]
MQQQVGLGGSCHWCTEAIFSALKGVVKVEQGWFKTTEQGSQFSEAIRLYFDPEKISLIDLIAIHIDTHSATSTHSMRNKYRSAIYVYSDEQYDAALQGLNLKQADYLAPLITQVFSAGEFKHSPSQYQNYYFSNPNKPFCEVRINPKLAMLLARYRDNVDYSKLAHLSQ